MRVAILLNALIVLALVCAVVSAAGCASVRKPEPAHQLPGHPWAYCGAFNNYCWEPPKHV